MDRSLGLEAQLAHADEESEGDVVVVGADSCDRGCCADPDFDRVGGACEGEFHGHYDWGIEPKLGAGFSHAGQPGLSEVLQA